MYITFNIQKMQDILMISPETFKKKIQIKYTSIEILVTNNESNF